MYKLYKCGIENSNTGVMKVNADSIISIPFAPDNTDYQEYLKWLAEGNTPEPADEGQP
jgi:hypothetical protein